MPSTAVTSHLWSPLSVHSMSVNAISGITLMKSVSTQSIWSGRTVGCLQNVKLQFVGNTLCVVRKHSMLNRHLLKWHQIQANDPFFAALSTLNLRGLLLLTLLKLPKSSLLTLRKLYLRLVPYIGYESEWVNLCLRWPYISVIHLNFHYYLFSRVQVVSVGICNISRVWYLKD